MPANPFNSFTDYGGYTHDLLPMPYTFAVARHTGQKIREASDFLEGPICVENVSSYAEYHASQMTEWEFLSEVVELADCGILLELRTPRIVKFAVA